MARTMTGSECSLNVGYCAGPCAGHGSNEACPPLIVLAVLALEQNANSPAKQAAER